MGWEPKQSSTYHLICAKHLFKMVQKVERVIALIEFTSGQKDRQSLSRDRSVIYSLLGSVVDVTEALAGVHLI